MTPERPLPPEPAGPSRLGPEARQVADAILARLDDLDAAAWVLTGFAESGPAFAAFLTLPDAAATEPLVFEQFAASYVGSWNRFESFRADVLRSLGWTDALDRFRAEHGIPEDHLDWNAESLDRHVLNVHDAVYLDGWWHVFYK